MGHTPLHQFPPLSHRAPDNALFRLDVEKKGVKMGMVAKRPVNYQLELRCDIISSPGWQEWRAGRQEEAGFSGACNSELGFNQTRAAAKLVPFLREFSADHSQEG